MPIGQRAGELDDFITIEHDTNAGLDPDYGSELNTWETFTQVWSHFDPRGGVEFFAAQQRTTKRQGTFKIYHNANITELMRIVFDGDNWDIHRIDLLGRREGMLLFATARGD